MIHPPGFYSKVRKTIIIFNQHCKASSSCRHCVEFSARTWSMLKRWPLWWLESKQSVWQLGLLCSADPTTFLDNAMIPVQLPTLLYRVHSEEWPFVCEVQNCGLKLTQKKYIRAHIKGTHSEEQRFACDVQGCGAWFKLKYYPKTDTVGVRWHSGRLSFSIENFHKERPLACGVQDCGLKLETKNQLTNYRKVHSGVKRVDCVNT